MVEGGGLENRCGATHRGFESHLLRMFFAQAAAKDCPSPGEIGLFYFYPERCVSG